MKILRFPIAISRKTFILALHNKEVSFVIAQGSKYIYIVRALLVYPVKDLADCSSHINTYLFSLFKT